MQQIIGVNLSNIVSR